MNVGTIDHLEYYVGDVAETASQLCDAYGFQVRGRGGPDTGLTGCQSVLLRQRDITILLTEPVDGTHPAAEYVHRHGDGVAVVGLAVEDAHSAFAEALKNGALPIAPAAELERDGVRVTFASVNGFGDVAHRFVARSSPDGPFAPGIIEEAAPAGPADGLFETIDHLAVLVPPGELTGTIRHYQDVFGFTETFEERIIVGSQAMDSKVVQSPSGAVTLTIIEPDTERAPGQIDEFVRAHRGAGVQHVAFLTRDIVTAVRTVSGRGVRFLSTPPSYYEALTDRLGSVGVPVTELREFNILADRDEWGVMLQIFTESQHPRRTFFYEVIDRRGALTFGSNNIKALYEAVERQRDSDQAVKA
jgi:4-hydroxymandelate synthase